MEYTFSGFTANMPTPTEYMHQIFDFLPDTITFMTNILNRPIYIVMLILSIVLGFIFALRN